MSSTIRHIILPDSGADLLRDELSHAFTYAGIRVSRIHPALCVQRDNDRISHTKKDFSNKGVSVPEAKDIHLSALLADGPALLLSINFQGLSSLQHMLELSKRHKSRIAVWCVDNPWNLLSGVRDPRWKEVPIFVTDDSFVPMLKKEGASSVYHLPLAASPAHFLPNPERETAFPAPEALAPFVFVGRSAFPDKELFFSGLKTPEELLQEASSMLTHGQRPDLLWWEKKLFRTSLQQETNGEQSSETSYASGEALNRIQAYRERKAGSNFNEHATPLRMRWPGKIFRRASLGAEESSLCWRSLCLAEAAKAGAAFQKNEEGYQTSSAKAIQDDGPPLIGLDIFGDAAWKNELPPAARLRSPVDYYARLPSIYTNSRFSLCLTSLQLPSGLNQRHFDVWIAGGIVLTDNTPGLTLFPEELVEPIRFTRASDIAATALRAESYPGGRKKLIADWQAHILEKHTYTQRINTILEVIDS